MDTSAILRQIRDLMKIGYRNSPIQALIVTNHDEHMSEYLAERDRRLKYVSGFSGSSGTAVITENEALMWADGRYFIQAAKEMDTNWTLMKVGVLGTPTEGTWLRNKLAEGSLVGTDPKLMPYSVWNNLREDFEQAGITLVPTSENLIDKIWLDKPSLAESPITTLHLKYAGESCATKLENVRTVMKERNADILILSSLDDIAWLLNLRGQDIKYNPVFFSFLVVRLNEIHLFIDEHKITETIREHFSKDNVSISFHPYEEIYRYIESVVNDIKRGWVCRSASYKIYSSLLEFKRFCDCSPISVMKAVKNEVEINGMVKAHIKDGIALCRFFYWIEHVVQDIQLTEISVAKVLEDFRKEEEDYVGPSFATISSSGPHAAITHYIPDNESDRIVSPNEIYLCDSGAQYLDGTTDVTRTVHFGNATNFEKECFTRVFQGQVALATAVFPYGIKGNCLDSLARKPLWDVGLDYKHGTGHGIGSYLFVHEGPMGISWRPNPDDPGLQPNMFLSDEPGYYHEGEFGIRIENILQIVPVKTVHQMPLVEKGFLTFNTITLCPIQIKLLDFSLLNNHEVTFLNEYHSKVRGTLGPILKERGFDDVYKWLEKETAPIIIVE